MRRRRVIHRSDPNQAAIVAGLRKAGFSVDVIGEPLDLLVGGHGRNYLLEVKVDEKAKLQPSQVEFFATWRGQKARVHTLEEALEACCVHQVQGSRVGEWMP